MKKKRGRTGHMAANIDMEKTFDFMEWTFLYQIFKTLGFDQIWINWIKECFSSTSSSILFNGTPNDFIQPSRGIMQGDPLSHFLFILGSEVLSRLIQREEDLENIKGI